MDIVHFTSELAPIAKVGGLGDVLYGLSKALANKGHRVRIFLPKYDILDYHLIEDLHVAQENLPIQDGEKEIQNTIWSAKYHDLELLLVETHHPKAYFDRGRIYGEEDDTDRFLFFCKAAYSALSDVPDVINLHDWPTAAAAELCDKTKIVFTIHNIEHQGRVLPSSLESLSIPYNLEQMRDSLYPEELNLLKSALYKSDAIVAVSPSYTQEIQARGGGFGLEEDLVQNKKKLIGILNGIDTHYWNPATDPFLTTPYSHADPFQGKAENKHHIQKHFGLAEEPSTPMVVAITRLVAQKGPDLLHYGIEKTAELGGQFILLGSTSDPEIHRQFEALQKHYETDPQIAIRLEYDESLSHMLYAAGDFFLMPSIFEPCGLAQMIALRYGSIPLVHATGGLKDTIFDLDNSEKPNGFTFTVPDNKGVASVLERGFTLYRQDPEGYKKLLLTGMQTDYSWDASADKYLDIYKKK